MSQHCSQGVSCYAGGLGCSSVGCNAVLPGNGSKPTCQGSSVGQHLLICFLQLSQAGPQRCCLAAQALQHLQHNTRGTRWVESAYIACRLPCGLPCASGTAQCPETGCSLFEHTWHAATESAVICSVSPCVRHTALQCSGLGLAHLQHAPKQRLQHPHHILGWGLHGNST